MPSINATLIKNNFLIVIDTPTTLHGALPVDVSSPLSSVPNCRAAVAQYKKYGCVVETNRLWPLLRQTEGPRAALILAIFAAISSKYPLANYIFLANAYSCNMHEVSWLNRAE